MVHENSGAYPCLNCGKKFAVKSTLDQHIISVHNKEERYRCDLCERGFSRKDYYQIHVRTVHEGSKPYSCDHCGSSYGQMGDMYSHDPGATMAHIGKRFEIKNGDYGHPK